MEEHVRDDADAADDLRRDEAGRPVRPEVPEADELEQRAEVHPGADGEPDEVGDRPEGDALEQARGAEGNDDEDVDRR
jgi:hypothetical protein